MCSVFEYFPKLRLLTKIIRHADDFKDHQNSAVTFHFAVNYNYVTHLVQQYPSSLHTYLALTYN